MIDILLNRTQLKDGSYIDYNAYDFVENFLAILETGKVSLIEIDIKSIFKAALELEFSKPLIPLVLERLNIDTWDKVSVVLLDILNEPFFNFLVTEEELKAIKEQLNNQKIYDKEI